MSSQEDRQKHPAASECKTVAVFSMGRAFKRKTLHKSPKRLTFLVPLSVLFGFLCQG